MKWDNVKRRMRIGREFKEGAYVVTACDDKGVTLTRVATGSEVRVTRKKTEDTIARLEAGERIPKRKISYTVAVEFGITTCIGDECHLVDGHWVLAE